MNNFAEFLLPNEPTCIVACSAESARFWLTESRFGDWTLITEMHDDQAAQRESEFASDRPGRSFDIVGEGRHAMSQKHSAQDHETLQFARQVAAYLNDAIARGKAAQLVLLAAPGMLGHLRSELSDAATRATALTKPLNLANLDEAGVRKYFE